eukprot:CAMPEP_0202694520 /NCGR_PEP_ID=MMETSP1385-20130828/8362_1 /ASSEMBLY_ACC=CAM_ASM_000861 /TAXON_ID=933848 /ORGANISM="Elphidium margaritaceum" /LENGTH=535 /DNA_ID=CAMNT_0049350383 /DNA_START=17 /DNA_END=1624 /DNA_ORIENTATION=+
MAVPRHLKHIIRPTRAHHTSSSNKYVFLYNANLSFLSPIHRCHSSPRHTEHHHLMHYHHHATRPFSNSSSSPTPEGGTPSTPNNDSHHTNDTISTESKIDDDDVFSVNTKSDAIDKRAYPIAFSSLLMGIGIGVILPVMPQFANEIGINTMQYGMVISVMGITRLVMNIPAAHITDKFGRKSTLVGGPLISSLGTLIIASAHSMNELILSRFVTGAGGAFQMAGAQAYLSDISSITNRARTMAPLMIGFSAGATLGPFIGGFLCDYYDSVRVPFIFVAGAISAVALNNHIMLPETLKKEDRKAAMSRSSASGEKQKNMFSVMYHEWSYLCKNLSHISGVCVHTAFWFCQAGATFTLMPLFATNELGMSATQIGYIFAMMSVVNICGAQLFARISDRFGRKKVIVPAVAIIASIVPMIPHVSHINELYGLMLVYSVGSTMLGTSPTAYIADIHSGSTEKEERRSQALAMLRSGGDVGLMAGSGLLGFLTYQTGSFVVPMCTASVILAVSGINFAFNARETVHAHSHTHTHTHKTKH